jgi:hypothetical protein
MSTKTRSFGKETAAADAAVVVVTAPRGLRRLLRHSGDLSGVMGGSLAWIRRRTIDQGGGGLDPWTKPADARVWLQQAELGTDDGPRMLTGHASGRVSNTLYYNNSQKKKPCINYYVIIVQKKTIMLL